MVGVGGCGSGSPRDGCGGTAGRGRLFLLVGGMLGSRVAGRDVGRGGGAGAGDAGEGVVAGVAGAVLLPLCERAEHPSVLKLLHWMLMKYWCCCGVVDSRSSFVVVRRAEGHVSDRFCSPVRQKLPHTHHRHGFLLFFRESPPYCFDETIAHALLMWWAHRYPSWLQGIHSPRYDSAA